MLYNDFRKIEAYYYIGIQHFDNGDYEKAIEIFTKILKLNPDDALTYHKRGRVYNIKNDYDNAIKDFTKAIKFNAGFTAFYHRGIAYYNTGDYNKA